LLPQFPIGKLPPYFLQQSGDGRIDAAEFKKLHIDVFKLDRSDELLLSGF
jgi:hypothetical protein